VSAPHVILLSILLPKIIKFGEDLTKLWQKQFCYFWDTVYTVQFVVVSCV